MVTKAVVVRGVGAYPFVVLTHHSDVKHTKNVSGWRHHLCGSFEPHLGFIGTQIEKL